MEEFIEHADKTEKGFVETVKESVLTGISHVIPLIVAGGMIAAICVIGARLFGFTELLNTEGTWLFQIKALGSTLLGTLMVPVLSAYMAYSIAENLLLLPDLQLGYVQTWLMVDS